VLLVEHHADLIFDICDRVTVLNLGKDAGRRHAGRDPLASGGGQCLPRRLNPLLEISGLSAGYGKIGVLQRHRPHGRRGRDRGLLGPTAPARPRS
jgi:hypothetical protein